MSEIKLSVVQEIADERHRQIDKEGWSPKHDDYHTQGELAQGAAAYAWLASLHPDSRKQAIDQQGTHFDSHIAIINLLWPSGFDYGWFKPKNPRRDLVRAGALIVAEIERLDREPKEAA